MIYLFFKLKFEFRFKVYEDNEWVYVLDDRYVILDNVLIYGVVINSMVSCKNMWFFLYFKCKFE